MPTEPIFFWTETKRPDQYDSVGQIAEGWYRVVDNHVQLCTAGGMSLGSRGRAKLDGKDPLVVARRLLRGIVMTQESSFNRPLPSVPRGPV